MIEEQILREISCLSQSWQEKDGAFREGLRKLDECVEKYLAENNIRDDGERLMEVIAVLPDCGTRSRLLEALYGRQEKGKSLQAAEQAPVKFREMGKGRAAKRRLKQIESQGRILKEKEHEAHTEQERLQRFVDRYLDENDLWNETGRVDEVIDALPAGIVRIRLLERRYGLLREEEVRQKSQEERMDMGERVKEPQQLSGKQVMGMEGMMQ